MTPTTFLDQAAAVAGKSNRESAKSHEKLLDLVPISTIL
jgi:hypothetical protein